MSDLEQPSTWDQSFQAISLPYVQDLIALCRATPLDNPRSVFQVIRAIYLIAKIDPSRSWNFLAVETMVRVSYGFGWREYFDQITERDLLGTEQDSYEDGAPFGHVLDAIDVIHQNDADLEALGQVLLAILRPSLPRPGSSAVAIIRANREVCQKDQCSNILLEALARSYEQDLEIIQAVVEMTAIDPTHYSAAYASIIWHAICDSNMVPIQTIASMTEKLRLQYTQVRPILDGAFDAIVRGADPDQLLGLIFSLFQDQQGAMLTSGIKGAVTNFLISGLGDVHYSRQLIWVVQNLPEIATTEFIKEAIIRRWAIQDDLFLFEAMTRFQIDREQLIQWREEQDHRQSPLLYVRNNPDQVELSITWLDEIHPKKSARSLVDHS